MQKSCLCKRGFTQLQTLLGVLWNSAQRLNTKEINPIKLDYSMCVSIAVNLNLNNYEVP